MRVLTSPSPAQAGAQVEFHSARELGPPPARGKSGFSSGRIRLNTIIGEANQSFCRRTPHQCLCLRIPTNEAIQRIATPAGIIAQRFFKGLC